MEIGLCENSIDIIRADAYFVQPVKNDFFCAVFTPAFRTTLPQALHKTFNNRNRHYTAKQFKQFMTVDADDGMQMVSMNFSPTRSTMASSSRHSRINACSPVSPDSTLPPTNSHRFPRAFWGGRRQIKNFPPFQISAATTSVISADLRSNQICREEKSSISLLAYKKGRK